MIGSSNTSRQDPPARMLLSTALVVAHAGS